MIFVPSDTKGAQQPVSEIKKQVILRCECSHYSSKHNLWPFIDILAADAYHSRACLTKLIWSLEAFLLKDRVFIWASCPYHCSVIQINKIQQLFQIDMTEYKHTIRKHQKNKRTTISSYFSSLSSSIFQIREKSRQDFTTQKNNEEVKILL